MRQRMLTAILAVLLMACGSCQTGSSGGAAADGDLVEAALSRIVSDVDGGAVVLTFRDGDRRSYAGGVADAQGHPLAANQTFRVGSISKPFVATIIMQMVDEGLLDIDQAVGTYLPQTPVGREVTIRQLLSHRSGISNYTDAPEFFADLFAAPDTAVSVDSMIEVAAHQESGEVGSFAYSNTNYLLLGQLAEQIDGADLNSILEQRITSPLALTSTYFATPDRPPDADLALAFSDEAGLAGAGEPYTALASSAWAAGALVSNTDDLATFLNALYNGDLVSPESRREMLATGADYYGLGLHAIPMLNEVGFGHGGGIPGYTSVMAIIPHSGDMIVVLTNTDQLAADRLAAEILAVW